MDTKFSTAIHSLIMISEAKVPISSEEIAESVGTNSSYVRKVLGMLKRAGIISSQQGRSGFNLEIEPADLTLERIYKAVNNNQFFNIHKNPSDKCIVGRHIKKTLEFVLNDMESAINKELSRKTLADCINFMKEELSPEELNQL